MKGNTTAGIDLFADHLGYPTTWPKWALAATRDPILPGPVHLSRSGAETPELSITPDGPTRDPDTGLFYWRLPFSQIRAPGSYRLSVREEAHLDITVSDGLWRGPLHQLIRAFYLQRCGTAISDPETGIRHRPCHTDDGLTYGVSVKGGWHFGPAYDKPVQDTAFVIGLCLQSYADHERLYRDGQLRIPESQNGRPDLLDEMQIGLDWLLTMQTPSGGVNSAVQSVARSLPVTPQDDVEERALLPVSAAATASAGAAWALAARVYAKYDPAQAARYREAAMKAAAALDPLLSNRSTASPPPGPAQLWLAAEIAILTQTDTDALQFSRLATSADLVPCAPDDPAALGLMAFLFARSPDPNLLRPAIETRLLETANRLLRHAQLSPFGVGHARFDGASSRRTAAMAVLLLKAYAVTGEPRYRTGAVDHLHYLLGRNGLANGLLSGIGSKPVKHLYHHMAIAEEKSLPGFVSMGPNIDATDTRTPVGRGGLSHLDDIKAHDSNAPDLSANALLVYLLAGLQLAA